jgi:hypothetical protein
MIEDIKVNVENLDLIIDKLNLIHKLVPYNAENDGNGIRIKWSQYVEDGDYVLEFIIITSKGGILEHKVHSANSVEIQCFSLYLTAFIHGVEFAQRGINIEYED